MQELVAQEEYRELVDECRSLASEMHYDVSMKKIEWTHKLSETINNSTAYKKHGKGSGQFIESLAGDLGISKSNLYQVVQFYQRFPSLSTLVETFKPESKSLTWNQIRAHLAAGEDSHEHEPIDEQKTITVTKCRQCGKRLN